MTSASDSESGRSGQDSFHAPPIITWRAIALGLATTVGMILLVSYIGRHEGVSSFMHSQLPMLALIPFVLWLFANVGLARIWPAGALKTGEMLTILAMLWIVSTVPGWIGPWTSIVASPTYFATPENRFADHFFEYLPWHMLAPTGVLDNFWFGLPDGASIPWQGWIGVVSQWLGVSLAMVIFGFCLFVLFQAQWEDKEKLSFPLAQLPQDLLQGMDGPRRMPELFRKHLFWIGFAVVAVPMLFNIGTYFTDGLLPLEFNTKIFRLELSEYIYRVNIRYMPIVMMVTYLCPVDILGSLILFRLMSLYKAETIKRSGLSFGAEGQQIDGERLLFLENYGALMFIAVWAIWMARGHLRQTWRLARSGVGPPREVVRYRMAWVGLVLSGAYVVGWAVSLGMSLPLAIGSFLLMSLTFFVTSKLIAATGFAYLLPYRPFLKGVPFIVDLVGTAAISERSLTGFHLFTSRAFFGTFLIPAWPALTHHLRLFSMTVQPAKVTLVALAVFVAGFLVSTTATIERGYDEGATVLIEESWMITVFFEPLVRLLNYPTVMDFEKMGVFLFGALQAGVMTFLRSRYHWFSLHPVGLAFQESFALDLYWINLAIVWAAKVTLLRYGGASAYAAGKPFFYGMGIGYIVFVALSAVVDLIWFPDAGHKAHAW